MATVVVHRLASSKKALAACQLTEDLYLSDRWVLAFLADPGRAATWDQYLWTFSQNSFVPHAPADAAEGADDAVVIVAGYLPPTGIGRTLVIVDGFPPFEGLGEFVEIHDFLTPTEEDANRAARWAGAGFAVVEIDGVGQGQWRTPVPATLPD